YLLYKLLSKFIRFNTNLLVVWFFTVLNLNLWFRSGFSFFKFNYEQFINSFFSWNNYNFMLFYYFIVVIIDDQVIHRRYRCLGYKTLRPAIRTLLFLILVISPVIYYILKLIYTIKS